MALTSLRRMGVAAVTGLTVLGLGVPAAASADGLHTTAGSTISGIDLNRAIWLTLTTPRDPPLPCPDQAASLVRTVSASGSSSSSSSRSARC